jgi:VWFA-related protein
VNGRAVAGAAAWAVAAATVLAATQPQEQRPTFRGGAAYVRLDVYPQSGDQPVADLEQGDFEVFEDGIAQRIETFERVIVRAGGPAGSRVEPSNVREARQMTADPRARLFVLFLDTYHVDGASGLQVRAPLLRLLNRAIGQDDLVAVMTPEMSGSAVTFTRRTGAIEELLDRYWEYGKRFRRVGLDPDEEMYDACYPGDSVSQGGLSDIAREMIDRRREKMALDALEDLVIHLEGLREERKAVFVVSEGWSLYRRNPDLARPIRGRAPGRPQVGVGPDGRLRSGDLGRSTTGDTTRCDQDRLRLADEDHEQQFRRLLDLANRANATFYPVDPRGLPVFDRPVGAPGAELSPRDDQVQLRGRLESLQTLASATDGLAVLNSNDIDAGLRRVVDDLSSYYLIGYYSTNTRLDGRFRSVKVMVKRPGVSVRTRRGYLAPTREEVEARASAGKGEGVAASPAAAAIAALGRQRANGFVHLAAGYEWLPIDGSPAGAAIWVVAELDASAARRDEQWKDGAEIVVALSGGGVEPVEGRHALSPAARSQRLRLPAGEAAPLPPGDYTVRVTSKPAGGALSTTESLHLTVPKRPDAGRLAAGQARLLRRGPFSGVGWQPAGDLRFRRQERVRIEVPVVGAFSSSATRLLDRNGNPLGIPVVPLSAPAGGAPVVGGELTLAPLAAGDYLLETTIAHAGGEEKILTAFRIVSG